MTFRQAIVPFCVLIVLGCGAGRPTRTQGHARVDPTSRGTESDVAQSTNDVGESRDAGSSPVAVAEAVSDGGASSSLSAVTCTWTDVNDPVLKSFRANAHKLLDEFAPGEKPNAIACCPLNDSDALCRTRSHRAPSPRDYRYSVYTRLVGVSAQDIKPWLDVPYEVAEYKTLTQTNPPWDIELALTVRGSTFSLRENQGKCPRKCRFTSVGCMRWERDAERACAAVGDYERSSGSLNRR